MERGFLYKDGEPIINIIRAIQADAIKSAENENEASRRAFHNKTPDACGGGSGLLPETGGGTPEVTVLDSEGGER